MAQPISLFMYCGHYEFAINVNFIAKYFVVNVIANYITVGYF